MCCTVKATLGSSALQGAAEKARGADAGAAEPTVYPHQSCLGPKKGSLGLAPGMLSLAPAPHSALSAAEAEKNTTGWCPGS